MAKRHSLKEEVSDDGGVRSPHFLCGESLYEEVVEGKGCEVSWIWEFTWYVGACESIGNP
ncbi:hypothetical protein QJS04_geneDACA000172 [Acorus gramineus]|uniref:Uncharacterized protein n=1 Tax=Acorus gramineus TaxID=55184 RepID=A0AAV9AT33_ACOGR|nr:hypothetical protein QJS04_geneDACA000172 [Acorus gramineus]